MMRNKALLHSVLVVAALAVMGVAVVTASPALAARGGKNGGGGGGGGSTSGTASIQLDQADPHLGDWVTFTTSGGSRVALACYQGGLNMVYSADQATGTAFLLGGTSSEWLTNGGDALCYAWLYSKNLSNGFLAATSFNAGG
jgi:hypothetical protein